VDVLHLQKRAREEEEEEEEGEGEKKRKKGEKEGGERTASATPPMVLSSTQAFL